MVNANGCSSSEEEPKIVPCSEDPLYRTLTLSPTFAEPFSHPSQETRWVRAPFPCLPGQPTAQGNGAVTSMSFGNLDLI